MSFPEAKPPDGAARPITPEGRDILRAAQRFRGAASVGPLQWVIGGAEDLTIDTDGGFVLVERDDAIGVYHAADGALLWTRREMLGAQLKAGTVLYRANLREIHGYAAETGRRRWCIPLRFHPKDLLTDTGADTTAVVFGTSTIDDVAHLTALDAPTGRVLWRRTIDGEWEEAAAGGGYIALTGPDGLAIVDLRTGQPTGRRATIEGTIAGMAAGRILVGAEDAGDAEVVAYDPSGERLWRVPADSVGPLLGLVMDSLLLVNDPPPARIVAYRLEDGTKVWSTDAGAPVPFGAEQGNRLFLASAGRLVIIDLATGSARNLPVRTGLGHTYLAEHRLIVEGGLAEEFVFAFALHG